MKLIVDIDEDVYTRLFDNGIQDNEIAVDDVREMARALRLGTPLDDVRAEIETERHNLADTKEWGRYYGLGIALEILDNIGKAESEEKPNE